MLSILKTVVTLSSFLKGGISIIEGSVSPLKLFFKTGILMTITKILFRLSFTIICYIFIIIRLVLFIKWLFNRVNTKLRYV